MSKVFTNFEEKICSKCQLNSTCDKDKQTMFVCSVYIMKNYGE